MAMSTSALKVDRDGDREGLQAAGATAASGVPSAATNTGAIPKEGSDTHACETEGKAVNDGNNQNGDAALNTTSGHQVTEIISEAPISIADGTARQGLIDGSTPSQEDHTTDAPGDGEEHNDSPGEERSAPAPLPKSSRGPDESLADYVKRSWTCEIKRASMQDWNKLSWSDVERPLPIVEAFYLNKPQSSVGSLEHNERAYGVPQVLGEPRNLQRIIINSEYLCQELKNLSSLPAGRNVVVISPPYKVLVRSLVHLEARLVELEARLDKSKSESQQNGTATPNASGAPSDSPLKMEETDMSATTTHDVPRSEPRKHPEEPQVDVGMVAPNDVDDEAALLAQVQYAHIKALIDFVKDDLGDVLQLRSKIRGGILRKIHFEDLWHLFEPGELMFSSSDDGAAQLYKSYFLSGGQSLKRPRTIAESREMSNLRERASYFLPRDMYEGKEEEDLVDEFLREESSNTGTWTPFKIDSYYMQFDGERCGPVEFCHKIWPFQGEQIITSLRVYPLRFHAESDAVLKAMIRRGREFLFDEGYKSYDGKTCYLERGKSQVSIQGDVYVDATAYYQDFPTTKPRLGRIQRSSQNAAEVEEYCIVSHVGKTSALEHDASQPPIGLPYDPDFALRLSGHELDAKLSDEFLTMHRLEMEPFVPREGKVSDDIFALMPRFCHGFSFQLRQWFPLSVDRLNEIDVESDQARKKGFEDLVISKRYQDLLVALVNSHASGLQRGKERDKNSEKAIKLTQIDIVRGKGQGLIILLHGPPGSGKTSTAETIAAYTRRPLYSITCGDIGTEPTVVESKLLEHTRRADRWGCVLLLDEADVFLVQRDWHNLHRNALTSIFLRQLEYYSGILFLTTNRPGVIDEAFKSRIHISLRYPGVDLESTMTQWKNILHRLEEENQSADVKIMFNRDVLLEFAKTHYEKCDRQGVTWNGRQIRNAFQTAIALGHYERITKIREAGMTPEDALKTGKKKWRTIKLTKANFANIAKTAREFEQYIETLRGSDSQNARQSELRYDEFDPERVRARKQYPSMESPRDGIRELQDNMRGKAGVGKGKKGGRVEPPPPVDDDEDEEEDEEEDDDDDDDEEDNDDF